MKNERTSARVAKIAGKVLKYDSSYGGTEDLYTYIGEGDFSPTSFKWADFRALAASALTQVRDKPKRVKKAK